MKKNLLVLILIVSIVGVLFCIEYSFPKAINVTYPAIQFRPGDADSATSVSLSIKGTLHRPLFRNQYFSGRIAVDKYDYSKYHMQDITFHRDIRNGWGNIVYFDDKPSGFTFGFVWKNGAFDNVKILMNEPVGPGKDGGIIKDQQIVAPAKDYQSALELSSAEFNDN